MRRGLGLFSGRQVFSVCPSGRSGGCSCPPSSPSSISDSDMMHRVRRTFLILLLMLVLAPGAALLARLLPEKAVSHLTNSYLSGVTKPVAPQWTLSSVLSGKLQNDLALWLGERMGRPRELMIRLNNGIGYGVGRSFSPYVIIGRERVLYPTTYVKDWCARPGRRNRVEGQAA